MIGRPLGPYRVVSLLGAGGMGEVYRARDPKLGRDVAIKVLPRSLAADPERLARFEREARVLASLNHPHIAAIYGFEEADGVQALVLELVEGDTLAERISAVPLAIDNALGLARQIAVAVSAAHDKGIIHRDLKPANIKIDGGGSVKVLDFGLAKVTERTTSGILSSVLTVAGTSHGVILGTAAYMSPEQARGHPVDARTDVWAFGCVLFEMLCGRAAFKADTVSDTFARVLEREPDWSVLPAPTPARIRELLRRCLQKDPARRLDTLAAAVSEIDATLASPFRALRGAAETVRWGFSRPVTRVAIVLVVLAAAISGYVRLRPRELPPPQLRNPVQVTSAVGVEDHPSWSPDNRTLAYESTESGNWDIWFAQVGGGRSVNRTGDHRGTDRYASWSPDGRQVAFWSDRDGGGYFVMPALGGEPIQLIVTPGHDEGFHSAPEWSADGTQLAGMTYVVNGERYEQFVEIVSVVTRDARRIALPGIGETRLDLSWSRDGQFLAYVDAGQQQSEVTQLRVLRLADGESTIDVDVRSNIRRPRWSADGRYLFYVCNCSGPNDLWRQPVSADGFIAGDAQRITTGLDVLDAAFSLDGSRITYSKGRWVSNFWRVPIFDNRPATWGDAEQVTFDQAYVEFLDVSPDGRQVAYSSDRSGNQDLWVMPLGGEPRQLTTDPAPDWAPSWSPDGRVLVFYSYRTGDRELYSMAAIGGPATQLTQSPGLDAAAHWSPDGREIAFRSERTGNSDIWVISADGSQTRQVTNHPAGDYLATWSPDGRRLAFVSNRSGQNQIWMVPAAGGDAEPLTRGGAFAPRWSRDGAHIVYVDDRGGNLWSYALANGRERQVTDLVGRRGTLGIMQPATDGKYLYFPWRDDLSDIWVMDVVQPD